MDIENALQRLITVSAALLIKAPALAVTYYVLRALDPQGSGWVTFHIADLTKLLGKHRTTLLKQLKSSKSSHWFLSVENLGSGYYKVHFRSWPDIHRRLGLDNTNGMARVRVKEVLRGRNLGIRILTYIRQNIAAEAALKKQYEVKGNPHQTGHQRMAQMRWFSPGRLFDSEERLLPGVVHRTEKAVFTPPNATGGACIDTIAVGSSLSRRTITRHLSDVEKCALLIERPGLEYLDKTIQQESGFSSPLRNRTYRFQQGDRNRYFWRSVNLYNLDFELKFCFYQRSQAGKQWLPLQHRLKIVPHGIIHEPLEVGQAIVPTIPAESSSRHFAIATQRQQLKTSVKRAWIDFATDVRAGKGTFSVLSEVCSADDIQDLYYECVSTYQGETEEYEETCN